MKELKEEIKRIVESEVTVRRNLESKEALVRELKQQLEHVKETPSKKRPRTTVQK